MNSALQCLAHTPALTEYFLSGVFKDELNPTNPLGMQGAIAEAFGSLLQRLYDTGSSSMAPREFKTALQRFAPQFIGYQQHDSQELLAFLLDGLHEDLNRILKKPYVENPDWEGGGEKELIKLARTTWDGYLSRNDSVIVDLFQGQYKSTLICPECSKVRFVFCMRAQRLILWLRCRLPSIRSCTSLCLCPWIVVGRTPSHSFR